MMARLAIARPGSPDLSSFWVQTGGGGGDFGFWIGDFELAILGSKSGMGRVSGNFTPRASSEDFVAPAENPSASAEIRNRQPCGRIFRINL